MLAIIDPDLKEMMILWGFLSIFMLFLTVLFGGVAGESRLKKLEDAKKREETR